MPTDFPFPPPRDAAVIALGVAGWLAFLVYGVRTLIRRARR